MKQVPVQAVPQQTFTSQLGGQACRVNIWTRTTGLYVDVLVNDSLIIGGVLALNWVRIVRDTYRGFVGDFAFLDTQPDAITGPADPTYEVLGSRFVLVYLESSDL